MVCLKCTHKYEAASRTVIYVLWVYKLYIYAVYTCIYMRVYSSYAYVYIHEYVFIGIHMCIYIQVPVKSNTSDNPCSKH